jgi:hypothetical protein
MKARLGGAVRVCLRRGGPVLLAAAVLAGCGRATGTIHGKVTYKGTPLEAGTVTFLCETTVKHAQIGPDGSYQIENFPVGPATVAVSTPASVRAPSGEIALLKMDPGKMGGGDGAKAATDRSKGVVLPKHYGSPGTSELRYTVTSGKQAHNIELD